jgi:protein O-mannosyl-transferase
MTEAGSKRSKECDRRSSEQVPPTTPRRVKLAGISLSLFAAVVWVFLPVLRHGFIDYDDNIYIYQNGHVLKGFSWESVRWAFCTLDAGFWHPLTWVSILIDTQIYGMKAWGHHLTSMLIHAASAVVLFLACWRMTGAIWRSAFVAALFGLHPLHVESVVWAAERKDVLSGFFWMLCILMYARYAETKLGLSKVHVHGSPVRREGSIIAGQPCETREGEPRAPNHDSQPVLPRRPRDSIKGRSACYYILSLCCFLCGLMSKPMVVTLPLILLLLDWWPLQRCPITAGHIQWQTLRRLLWEKVPFLLTALIFGIVTILAERGVGALRSVSGYPLAGRVQNAFHSYVWYLEKTLWPRELTVYYPYPQSFPIWSSAGAVLGVLLITAGVLFWSRRRPYLAAGWLWYLGTLLPMIGLLQVGSFSRADRFTYVPLIGVFLLVVWGVGDLSRRWRLGAIPAVAAGISVLLLCCAITRRQISHWDCDESLWRHGIVAVESNYLAHLNLGALLVKQGLEEKAIPHYEQAVRADPSTAYGHADLAYALAKMQRFPEAIQQYREALRLNPADIKAHNNLGNLLRRPGQLEEAMAHFRSAIALDASFTQARYNLGIALMSQKQFSAAALEFEQVLRLKEDDAQAREALGQTKAQIERFRQMAEPYEQLVTANPKNAPARAALARVLFEGGWFAEAIAQWREAVQLAPTGADQLNNLAWLLATCPQSELRNGSEAVKLAARALELAGTNNVSMLDTLAAAYAEAGRFKEALEVVQQAVTLALDRGQPDVAEQIRRREAMYRSGRPYREGGEIK